MWGLLYLWSPLWIFSLTLLLLGSGDARGPLASRQWLRPSRSPSRLPQGTQATPRKFERHQQPHLLWLLLPGPRVSPAACQLLRTRGSPKAPASSVSQTIPARGVTPISPRTACCAAAAAVAVVKAASPFRSCTWKGTPGRTLLPEARKWLSLFRYLRSAPTSDDRLRRLMELGLQGSPTEEASGVPHFVCPPGAQRCALQREDSTKRDTAAAAAAGTGGKPDAAAAEAPTPIETEAPNRSRGFLLIGSRRSVEGCAADASVRVSLLLPETLPNKRSSRSSGSSSRLCCAAAAQGVTVYVQGASDSLLVGGLLQLLAQGLSGGPPCEVWALGAFGASQILQRSGLLRLLPETRARGLRGSLEALVASTQELLQRLFAAKGPPQGTAADRGPADRLLAASIESPSAAAGAGENDTLPRGPFGLLKKPPRPSILPPVGPPGSLLLHDVETAEWTAKSRTSLPAVGGAGAEVYVLLSGGVDSSVSLLLLREWGFRPKPIFLKVWAPEAAQLQQQQPQQRLALAAAAAAVAACPWQKDVEAATAAAAAAGLKLDVVPMQQQYWDRVVTSFLEGARKGLTPNPDWSCNSLVKFGAFAEAVGDSQAAIASGHYARIQMSKGPQGGRPRLFRGVDEVKDQAYFLSGLDAKQLSRLLLPVGALLKSEVRQLALRWGLPSAQRPDSQGLCFLGPLAVGPFLAHLLGEKEGPVLHFPSGTPLGRHKGLWGFTAGQQRGVVPLLDPRLCRRCRGATGGPPTLSGPWSVVGKSPEANALFVVSKEEETAAEARVRALVLSARGSPAGIAGQLLQAATKDDPAALLAVKLRQLRTHLRVDNLRWIGGSPPPECVVPVDAREGSRKQGPDAAAPAAAAAAAAVASAQQGAAVLSGRLPRSAARGAPKANGELVVQVRHSAAFEGVAKHRFKTLRVSEETLGTTGVTTTAELLLEEPDVGLAPGQVAAIFRGDECLGSGHISALQSISLRREALGTTE